MVTTISDIQCYSFLFFVSLITTFLIRSILSKPTKVTTNSHLLPSPQALPIIGHLHLLGPSLYKSLHNLSTKYGPLLYISALVHHTAYLFLQPLLLLKYSNPKTLPLLLGQDLPFLTSYSMELQGLSLLHMLITGGS